MTVLPQHLQALEHANQMRLAKAEVKRDLREQPPHRAMMLAADMIAGDHDPIGCPDGTIGAFRLGELLAAIPRCGPQKQRAIAHRARMVSIDRRIRDLTERERLAVAAVLRAPVPGTVFWREAA